jgi:hypothetical protein
MGTSISPSARRSEWGLGPRSDLGSARRRSV